MEKKLERLFDYQRFEKNERLEKIIKETGSRYAKELSDDDLSLVNAAGEMNPGKVKADSEIGAAGIGGGTRFGGLIGDCKNQGNVSGSDIAGENGGGFLLDGIDVPINVSASAFTPNEPSQSGGAILQANAPIPKS